MNISGTINSLRVLYNPALFMPHTAISTFESLPIPLPEKMKNVPIKVVLLDKDNCFAKPHDNHVWPAYENVFKKLRQTYPGDQLMIVSNTAGSQDDPGYRQASLLEERTGVKVFQHITKKPGCSQEVLDYLHENKLITRPEEVAVVGDRLMTDIVMANMIGASSVWIRDGVIPNRGMLTKFELTLYNYMSK